MALSLHILLKACDISGALIVNGWRQKWIDKKKEKKTWRGIVCETEKIEVW